MSQAREDTGQTEAPTLARRTSTNSQPLRHGRKPIYPDSDAEAEGLDADVDDEQLETGAHPGQGDHEQSTLLSNGATANNNSVFDKTWLQVSKLWGGDKAYAAKLAKRRKQRRTTRRNSRSGANKSSFAAWRQDHTTFMGILYGILGLFVFVLILVCVAFSHLYFSTLKTPSPEAQSRILDESLLLRGPDRVQLLNISDDGILVRVDARLGLDPDHALDLWLGQRGKQGWWKNKERKLVEWGMGKVAGVQIEIGEVRLAELGAEWISALPSSVAAVNPQDMLAFHLDPLVLPLPRLNRKTKGNSTELLKPPILGNHSTPAAQHNMNALNLTVLLKPVVPAQYIMNYVQHAMKRGNAQLDVKIASLRVRGLAKSELNGVAQKRKAGFFDVPRRIDISQHRIRSPVDEKVPRLGNDTADDLLQLDGFEFFEVGGDDDGDKNPEKGSFLTSLAARALGIRATAQAKNPLGKMLQGNVRYSLPFGIFLPVELPETPGKHKKHFSGKTDPAANASVLLAAVATEPFALTGQKEVQLNLSGIVVPPPQDLLGNAEQLHLSSAQDKHATYSEVSSNVVDSPQQIALSNFLSKFLRGQPNTLFVRGGSPFREPADDVSKGDQDNLPGQGSVLPDWMDSALRLLDVPISFPGSKVTELIKNVTINDLKISPHPFEKDKLLCSGTVMGEINMPGQLSTVDIQITHMWPDILVYDGKPPSMRHDKSMERNTRPASKFSLLDGALDTLKQFTLLDNSDKPDKPNKPEPEPAPPLPDPLPEKAFGRVRPYDFAPAETFIDPEDPKGERKLLRAVLTDVPFTVLPGRGALFRSFTWKLLTGQGALVGIEGTSRAKVWNAGLGLLQLRNLPVKGAFMLGKRD